MRNSTPVSNRALSTLLVLGLSPALAAQGFEQHKLLPNDGLPGEQFGATVATDGNLVAVGSSGSAYLFDASTGVQNLELVASTVAPGFGASVAVDGAYAVVGDPLADGAAGTVYVFDSTTGLQLLELQANGLAAGDRFGVAVAIDEGLIVVGALQAAYLFDASTGQQLEELIPDGGLPVGGTGVSILDGGFGQAVDIEGGLVVVGAKNANGASLYSGAAYVFDTSGDELCMVSAGPAWSQFGGSVGISGNTVVCGAKYASPNGKDSGQAYLFDALEGKLMQTLVPSDGHIFAHFGSSVGIDGQHVVVGAEQDNQGGFSSGALYLYSAQGGSFVTKLLASDGTALDGLGEAVAVAQGVMVAGAPSDDDNGSASGAAYVFDAAGTVTAMSECLGNVGALDHVGGIAVAGQTLVFRMDQAQPGATLSVLLASAAPTPGWPTCGIDLGSPGDC